MIRLFLLCRILRADSRGFGRAAAAVRAPGAGLAAGAGWMTMVAEPDQLAFSVLVAVTVTWPPAGTVLGAT